MRLKLIIPEEAGGEGAQREAKASVEVGGEDNVFAFLGVGVNFSLRRYPRHHPFWDSPASAKPVDIPLSYEAAGPRRSGRFLRTFLPFLPLLLGFFGIFFPIMLGV